MTRSETPFVQRQLPAGALTFVRERLWLARGLEPFLDRVLVENAWHAWTLAKPDTSDARLERYRSGGGGLSPGSPKDHVCRVMEIVHASAPNAAMVLPDPMARPGDSHIARAYAEPQIVDDGVYYVERIEDLTRVSSAWLQIAAASGEMGVLTSYAVPSRGLDEDDLRMIAAQAMMIAMTAYDGEGIIFVESEPAGQHRSAATGAARDPGRRTHS